MNIENEIASIGFKRSGYGAGEIDFSIRPYIIEKLHDTDVKDLKSTLYYFNRVMVGYVYKRLYGKKKRWLYGQHVFMILKNPRKFLYWPIRFGWAFFPWTNFLDCHGWQEGKKYGWTFHIGRFQIRFGK
jgi:hypothetical protein